MIPWLQYKEPGTLKSTTESFELRSLPANHPLQFAIRRIFRPFVGQGARNSLVETTFSLEPFQNWCTQYPPRVGNAGPLRLRSVQAFDSAEERFAQDDKVWEQLFWNRPRAECLGKG